MSDLIRQCRLTGKDFVIADGEQAFLNKRGFPLPNLCPEERHRRRLAYRNERKLYKAKCDLTGKPMISLYSPEKKFKVYSQEAWWSDDWDARDYGRDYDFSRPFFDQFRDLQAVVPRMSLFNTKSANSEYCNFTTSNKNCYLVFGGDFNEDCMYSIFCFYSRDCSDLYWVNRSELCYECVDCNDLYNCKFSVHSYNCKDSAFLYDCRSCSSCFGCVGLRNKEYYFFNKPCSKEDYELKVAEYNLRTNKGVKHAKADFAEFKLSIPHRASFIINCENCTGNDLVNCKNCVNCFDIEGPAEDVKDVLIAGWNLNDAYSSNHVGHGANNNYELSSSATAVNCYFGNANWYSSDLYYCDAVVNNSHDLFGCCGMKKAEYCILNKQYTKEAYLEMLPKICEHMKSTGEWGEFFPIENSPFAYNETIAHDYLPMAKGEVLEKGLCWQDEELASLGDGDVVPDSIDDVDDSIFSKTFVCAKSGRPYKINDVEMKFYKKMGVPIPHFAPETRNVMRFNSRSPWNLWDGDCAKCGKLIKTTYAPNRPEKVYCEECYLAELY